MNNYRKELWFEVPSRPGFFNITPTDEECLRERGGQEGLVLVNCQTNLVKQIVFSFV